MPVAARITIKRGDSIAWTVNITEAGTPLNLTGYTVECEVRAAADRSLAVALTVALDDQGVNPGVLTLSAPDTSALAPGHYVVDLRYTIGTSSRSTESWSLVIGQEVTER